MPGDELKLQALQYSADQAVLDPSKWVEVCDRLADYIGGVGAAIGPDAVEYQLPGLIVASPSLEGLMTTIFRDGWINRSYRRRAIPIIKQRGFATDHDIADERTLRTEPYYADLMASHDLGIFVGLNVLTTTHTFIAGVQRSASAPPPDDDLFERVDLARPIIASAARASVAVGGLRIEGWKDLAIDGTRAVFVLDPLGRVIDRNAAAEPLIGSALEISHHQLRLLDPRDDQQLARMIEIACAAGERVPLPRPVFTTHAGQGGLMLEAVRLPLSLRHFHSLAAALIVVRSVEDSNADLGALLKRHAGLTTAELKVALALFEGQSPAEYAQNAGLSTGTVRQQIKSIYRKTGTGRQNELSALIRRLLNSISN
jgi:DNA-binding CsgD family transcriptional regulator/PAS domain-containing protein